ncbi:MAG: hypothetical protein ACYTDV_10740, partial [Planctomycetota bacterium]
MDSTARRNIGPSRLGELEGFGKRINKLGVNFAVSDAKGEIVLVCEGGRFKSSAEQLTRWSRQVLDQDDRAAESGEAGTPVRQFDGANKGLAVALKSARLGNKPQEVVAAALIDLGDSGSSFACETESTTGDAEPVRPDGEHFAEMLRLLAEKFQAETKAERQIEEVSTELSQTYEELVLLHRLSTNMKVTEADSNFLQMACDSLTEIVYVEGIAILLEKTVNGAQQWVIAAGSGLIDMDEQTAVILQCRLAEEIGKGKEA